MIEALDGHLTNRWCQALNLRERAAGIASFRETGSGQVDRARGQARFERWRSQPQFAADAFARRLALDGIDEGDLRDLLGEATASLSRRTAPDTEWARCINDAYAAHPDRLEPELTEDTRDLALARGLVVVGPLIESFRRRLRADLAELIPAPMPWPLDVSAIERMLYGSIPRQLLSLLSRALVLELNVLRLQGSLSGATPAERFDSFIAHLSRTANARALLEEYPVLARAVVDCLDNWRRASVHVVEDLARDWPALTGAFPALLGAGPLTAIRSGAGDLHRGGRSVVLMQFASGFQLVYKPRSLAVDAHFQQLLQWVNGRAGGPPFRILQVVTRDDHGWVEFVASDVQVTVAQAHAYFERLGAYLALLYLLEATDFHYENLVIAGEHPVLVDLEALFQPRLQDDRSRRAGDVAGRELNYSVLRVGLLPQRLFTDLRREGLDVSALGARAGQVTPFELPMWAHAGMDDMHLIRQPGTFTGAPHQLHVDGQPADPRTYTDDIVSGFERTYRLLIQHRDDLSGDRSPLRAFRDDEVRVLLRATRTYARLLQESFHPDVLRDALDRDRLFDALWSDVDHVPEFPRVIAAERRQLWNGDVPVFTARPGGRALRTGDRHEIEGFFAECSLELVQRQLHRLDEADLTRQSWYVRGAMATLSTGEPESSTRPRLTGSPLCAGAAADPAVQARLIGDRLAALAIRGDSDASWIGLALINDRTFDLAPLELDLYDGLPGVALFLAYLGAVTGDHRYTELARATVTGIRAQLAKARRFERSVGAFNGWGGLLHLFTHVGALWGDRDLLDEAEALVALLPPLIAEDRQLDVIGGAAGCLFTLLNLHATAGSQAALDAADRCGARLLETARAQTIGAGWMTNVPSHQPLAGFSHGSAGIAAALLELAVRAGRRRYAQLAQQALAYERTLFNAEHGNWIDARVSAREGAAGAAGVAAAPRFQYAWCHGAPGIGLGRLRALPYLDDGDIRGDIAAAVTATLRQGHQGTHCLCHGSLGNLDTLLMAERLCPDVVPPAAGLAFRRGIVDELARSGPACANPAGIESPGLMTGLAGIGYGLLRMLAPDTVPSILALEPPRVWRRAS